jgi:secreted PhoX family phosphatase
MRYTITFVEVRALKDKMNFNRRQLIGGATGLAFSGLARHARATHDAETYINETVGYGPLRQDPHRLLDLPDGFTYRIISRQGQPMDDGLVVPGQFDGMGCFPLENSRLALVRNHELKGSSAGHRARGPGGPEQGLISRLPSERAYDTFKDGTPLPGGTTTLIYDLESGQTVRQHLSLAGTSTNCCGGQTPWGSWLSCEETEETPETADVMRTHGWVFEVPADARGLVDPLPLKALGRFDHEAVCIDPSTGVVYLTEDKVDGLFYRFLPNRPGRLLDGGRLQAMVFREARGADSSNHSERFWSPGDWHEVDWIDLDEVESPTGDLRHRGHSAGGALVARGEGIHWGDGELYLTATSGGPIQRGQILRYRPSPREGQSDEGTSPGRIQLFVESGDERALNMGDNLTVAPWGHLIVCEDNYSDTVRNHLKGVTPEGRLYTLARNVSDGNSEFAGAVFSPDGRVLFVNIQSPGLTLAIEGPWRSVGA